jgi:hypothetical protein
MGRKSTHPLVLAALALLLVAPAAGGARAKCAPKKGYVLVARSSRLALFTSTGEYFDTRVCSYRTGKRHFVPEDPMIVGDDDHPAAHTVAARGRYAAFIFEAAEGPSDYYEGIELVDESGRSATVAIVKSQQRHYRHFVLKASGAIAWSEKDRGVPTIFACLRRCLKYDAIPPHVQLARGGDIDVNSLRGITGGITWHQGHRWRRARMPSAG